MNKAKGADWWAEAERLKAEGLSERLIADHFGKTIEVVRYAINPDYRERRIANRKRYHSRMQVKPEYPERRKMRRIAREEYKEKGGNLDKLYVKYGCA